MDSMDAVNLRRRRGFFISVKQSRTVTDAESAGFFHTLSDSVPGKEVGWSYVSRFY